MNIQRFIHVLTLLSFTLSAPLQAQDKPIRLMLDWFVNPDHAPIIVARQQGFFKKLGLDISIEQPADPSTPSKLVAANKVDWAVSYQPSLIMDAAAGLPLMAISTLIATPLNTLTVLKSSQISHLTDLKGKAIGISGTGSAQKESIETMLSQVGLSIKQVKLVDVGWALTASLAAKKVDAIWGGYRNIEVNQLALKGYETTSFYPEEWGIPYYNELIVVANAKHFDQDAIAKFNTALEQAVTFILNHPQQAWQSFVAFAPDTLKKELNYRIWKDSLRRFALRPAAIEPKRYRDYAHYLFKHHAIKSLPNPANYLYLPAKRKIDKRQQLKRSNASS